MSHTHHWELVTDPLGARCRHCGTWLRPNNIIYRLNNYEVMTAQMLYPNKLGAMMDILAYREATASVSLDHDPEYGTQYEDLEAR